MSPSAEHPDMDYQLHGANSAYPALQEVQRTEHLRHYRKVRLR